MKKIILIAAAAAVACAASAQNNGQLHFLTPDGSRMFKSSEISKITYEGNETDGFTHMNVATTSGEPVQIALDGITGCEVRGVGLPDTDLSLASKTSEEMSILTSNVWKPAGIGYDYGEGYDFWLPDCCADDILSFTADNKVSINLGADNKVYDDDNGENEYTFTGEETYLLGTDSEGKLQIQFANGGFPVIRPNSPGLDLRFEVRKITEAELEIAWPYGDSGFFVLGFKNPNAFTIADKEIPEFALLTAQSWKTADKYSYYYGQDDAYETPSWARDEVITFNADGSLTLTTEDNLVYMDDGDGRSAFTPTGNESWELGKNAEGKLCVRFSNGGFPIMRPTADVPEGAVWEILDLTETSLRLGWPYGDTGYFVVILEPKE